MDLGHGAMKIDTQFDYTQLNMYSQQFGFIQNKKKAAEFFGCLMLMFG